MDEEKDLLQEVDIEIAETEEVEGDIATVSTTEDAVGVSESASEATQTETIEYIMVEEPEELVVEVDEAFVGTDGVVMPEHTHGIGEIERLENTLNILGSTKDIYSAHSGFAEFRKWKDLNPNSEYRIGYFVSLINNNGNECIDICNTQSDDVYGVTVSGSGFCGYQYSEYNILYDQSKNKADSNEPYEKVCLLGTVMARVYSSENFDAINIGDFVIPDEYGCAIKSENNIGFKVIMKEAAGTGENAWNKVAIALVPQNDNVARVMKKLEETNKGLDEINVQLGNLNEKVDTNISISGDFEDLKDLVNQNVQNVDQKLEAVDTTLKEAEQISSDAKAAITDMQTNYEEAMNRVEMAESDARAALGQINDYDLKTLAEYKGNIVNFFTDASEDGVSIGTIARTQGDVSMLKQSSNTFQHLVCHIDVYSVGNQSPTDGLSYDEAEGALGNYEYIYVPINTHEEISHIYKCTSALQDDSYCFEINSIIYSFKSPMGYTEARLEFNARTNQLTIDGEKIDVQKKDAISGIELVFVSEKITTFTQGKSYKWSNIDGKYLWAEYQDVSFAENPPSEGYELWYTRNGIQDENNNYIYNPGTLYCFTNELWVAVATINDNNARTMSLINQTADTLSSTITNVAGEVSTLEQTVTGISATVDNNKGQLSQINQTAENIRLGLYDSGGGASSLELLLSGLRSDAINTEHAFVCEILDMTPQSYDENGLYYSQPPIWNGTSFSFDEIPSGDVSDEFKYCPGSKPNTYYEKTSNGYKVYTNGNQAIASLRTRVTDTEAEVESWTNFKTEVSDTMTKITQSSSADVAELAHIVMGKFLNKIESVISPTEEQLANLPLNSRYSDDPKWDETIEKFTSKTQDENGKYCISDDGQYYYELTLDNDGNIIGYEKYELKTSNYASLVQKVDGDKSYVGLVAGNDDNMGSVVARTINDKSEVLIEADKIGIAGTAVFSDSLVEGKTSISGNYIKTGVITSNNYSGPVTYRMYGAAIDEDTLTIIKGNTLTDCIYYAPTVEDGDVSTEEYYYVDKIEAGEKLFVNRQVTSKYVVSAKNFDLVSHIFLIQGTKFDLNEGTIYSKNLSLNRDGDLTISGRITATSGYIGNQNNGFLICCDGLVHTVSTSTNGIVEYKVGPLTRYKLPPGDYYCEKDNIYYLFTTNFDILVDSLMMVDTTMLKMYVGSDEVDVDVIQTTDEPSDATLIEMIPISHYSLSNGQWSYFGDGTKNPGVYIGPDGIGLGNGNFYVDKSGCVNTFGDITMHGMITEIGENGESETKPIELVKIADGNLKLTGNITLGGNITWDMENSPVKSQYSSNYTNDDNDDNDEWHEGFKSGDKYMRMSFDGGNNWNTPTKIVGQDGMDGTNATVTPETVFNALTNNGDTQGIFPFTSSSGGEYSEETDDSGNFKTQLFINAEYIRSGTLSGVNLKVYDNNTDQGISIIADRSFEACLNFGNVGKMYPNVTNSQFNIESINGAKLYISGNDGGIKFGGNGYVDFSDVTVTGLGIVPEFE